MKRFTLVLALFILAQNAALAKPAAPIGEEFSMAEFADPSGLRLRYPQSWKKTLRPDKDTLAKFSGALGPNSEAEITVAMADSMGLSTESFARTIDDLMFSKLERIRKSPLRAVRVGSSGRLSALSQTVAFTIHHMPIQQEYLFIAGKNKIITLVLTTQPSQRSLAESAWKNCTGSINAPESLIELGPKNDTAAVPEVENKTFCSAYSSCVRVERPEARLSLEQKIAAVLPKKEEERFLEIPWQFDLLAARRQSQLVGKPLFIWIMDGNVLGAT